MPVKLLIIPHTAIGFYHEANAWEWELVQRQSSSRIESGAFPSPAVPALVR